MKSITDTSIRKAGLVAGLAILIMAIAAGFSVGYVNESLIVAGDALTSFENIRNSLSLFRAGILGWLIILICDVLAAWGLYVWLKNVNPHLSLLTAWLRLIYTTILGIALLNYLVVLLMLSSDSYQAMMPVDQLSAQMMLLLQAFESMWSLGLIIFGGHLLSLGYLLSQSRSVPKVWSILILIAGIGYILIHLSKLILPQFETYHSIVEMIFILPMILGELGLGIYLIIKAAKNNLSTHE
ncbi:MAG: DUF4386 domain-containing protein [Bacteroidia bacterium]